jgi:acetyl-CoA carboxylase, biotin carboxylase subunit
VEIRKLLVANRGEIALRVFRTCRELGIGTVAVAAPDDRGSLHARSADETVEIGSYLQSEEHIRAAKETGADGIHPGYGFLAENPEFAAAVEAAGLVFVGPTPEALRLGGDKLEAKRIAEEAGVPVVPTGDPEEIGYPLIVKAAAGGGGRGMRVVRNPSELDDALEAARREAMAAFGDDRIFFERYVERPRHVEIQVLADGEGGVLTLGERECSIQRRHQKLIEESPSPALTPDRREEMEAAAERACEAIGYRNAGTFEFLLGPEGAFYFIELNARLQVEHPVSELVTGIDIVREQLRIAAGERLARTGRAERRGHAIEVRLNAEDPARDFAPSPGRITRFRPPAGPGIRLDTYVEEGTAVPPHYDSLLGKLIVWDESRPEAIARALRALGELQLDGIPTTRALAIDVLRSEGFASGRYSTEYLAEAAAALPALAEP